MTRVQPAQDAAANLRLVGMSEAPSVFSRIVSGEIPTTLLAETDRVIAFADINPQAPVHLLVVPKTAEYRDVGAATGSLLFLRSMGGAFGSTLVGSLLAARFAAGLRAAGLPADVDLGSLRAGAGVLGPALNEARDALTSGFELSFGVCAGVMLVAAVVAAGMQDVQLRSGAAAPRDIGH